MHPPRTLNRRPIFRAKAGAILGLIHFWIDLSATWPENPTGTNVNANVQIFNTSRSEDGLSYLWTVICVPGLSTKSRGQVCPEGYTYQYLSHFIPFISRPSPHRCHSHPNLISSRDACRSRQLAIRSQSRLTFDEHPRCCWYTVCTIHYYYSKAVTIHAHIIGVHLLRPDGLLLS